MDIEQRRNTYKEYLDNFFKENNCHDKDATIEFPFPWKLEDNKFSFDINAKIIMFPSSNVKILNIYGDFINYTNTCNDEVFKESSILSKHYHKGKYETSLLIEDIIVFFLNFRRKYTYSKILDEIILKSEIVQKEKMSFFFFKESDPFRETTCCVCADDNLIFTKCNHNLCRICFSSLQSENNDEFSRKCPLCRELLFN